MRTARSQPSSRSSGVRHCILSYLAFRASRPLARSLDRRPRSRAAEGLLVGPNRGAGAPRRRTRVVREARAAAGL